MKRKKLSRIYSYILHQIYNEKHSNWALLAELLIVSCIVWYLVDCSYTIIARNTEPTGFDATNCYNLVLEKLGAETIGYDSEHPESEEEEIAAKLALLDRIRRDADIEAAAFSVRNDPYDLSSRTSGIRYDTPNDTLEAFPRFIQCQPDFLKVFRYRSLTGKTPEQLADILKDNYILLSEGIFGKEHDVRQLIGKEIFLGYYGPNPYRLRLGDVIAPVKRYDAEELIYTNVAVLTLQGDDWLVEDGRMLSLSIRVKEGRTKGFEERFREKIANKKMRAGNYYVSNIISYEARKQSIMRESYEQMRFYAVALAFLLVNVFFGLLGTFWFRTQQRFSEIGLQKALGATNTDITLRLLTEAAWVLTIAFIPSLIIDWSIADAGVTNPYRGVTFETERFIVCAAITYGIMLLIIALGIWFPALRATKSHPAEVLRGE